MLNQMIYAPWKSLGHTVAQCLSRMGH
uniref:Uncharacterized protein n=1 Tax=Anguilla anguilla TaxID=7936 RepID=A0A0E9P954_ANGAN